MIRLFLLAFFLCFCQITFAQDELDQAPVNAFSNVKSARDVQKIVSKAVGDGKESEVLKDLNEFLIVSSELPLKNYYAPSAVADSARFITMIKGYKRTDETTKKFLQWMTNPKRMNKLLYTLCPQDDSMEVLKILESIYRHDKKEVSKYFNLALALAVVWDTPRTLIHHQQGKKILKFSPNLIARYDDFKMLYKKRAKMSYRKLSVQYLIFVVNTPVPISELVWARKNVKSSVKSWAKLYPSIVYNHDRLNKKQYDWIQGDYTLAGIKKCGGICVDQTYFTVMTARANGIPAMFFSGVGRNAGERHAWAGYMLSPKKWNFDVGRYAQYNFCFGNAQDPQSNTTLTDHMLDFKCNPVFQTSKFIECRKVSALANYYSKLGKTGMALKLALKANSIQPLYLPPWKIRENAYFKQKAGSKLMSLLRKKLTVFKKYPDFVKREGELAVKMMRDLGRDSDATKFMKMISKNVGDRDDLNEDFTFKQIDTLYKSGKTKEGRKMFEHYFKGQKKTYEGLVKDMAHYLELTKAHDQTKSAVRFLKKYSKGARYGVLKESLRTAYKNNGDTKKASKL